MDRDGGYELVSLSSEYGKHLSSIVLNNYNLLFGLSPAPFKFPLLILYIHQLNCLYSLICKICDICDSETGSRCDCTCDNKSSSNSKFICICISNCSGDKPGNCVCICICNKKDDFKCITICICDKEGLTCPCACGTVHSCEKCLVKVDIQSLLSITYKIICGLRWIRWYISRIENKCSCFQNERCGSVGCIRCRSIINYYKSIISNIHSIEYLFKEVGTKIGDLRILKNILSLISAIATKCPKCPQQCCNDKIDSLIKNIQKALRYYSSFASVIGDIRMLVDYKTFCPQANEIIEKLKLSVNPLLHKLDGINHQIVNSVTTNNTSDQLLFIVYSHYCIFQCFLAMYTLLQSSSKISTTIYNIIWSDMCECQRSNGENNSSKISEFEKYLVQNCNKGLEDLNKLIMNREGNYLCLCLVIKHILYPSLIRLMYYHRMLYYESLSKLTREFIPKMFMGVHPNEVTKLTYMVIKILDKIVFWIKNKYYYGWLVYTKGVYIQCFCKNHEDPYYPYLISTILFMSSLVENIWSMDTETVKRATEKISSLLSEYQSLHVYTNYGSGKSTSNVSSSTALPKVNLLSTSLTQYTNMISITSTSKKSNCNGKRNGNSSMILHTQINRTEVLLLNTGVKSFFKTVLSSLTILIKTPLFSLVYSNISGLAFYLNDKSSKLGLSSISIRRDLMGISIKYLNEICTKKKECSCKVKNECKICIVGRIISLSLEITLNTIRFALGSAIKHLMVDSLKLTTNAKIHFVRNGLINGNIDLLRRTKNNLLTSSSYGTGLDNIIDVTSVRNWGYDTLYEHQVTNLSNESNMNWYPNLTSCSPYNLRSTRNMFQVFHIKLNIQ